MVMGVLMNGFVSFSTRSAELFLILRLLLSSSTYLALVEAAAAGKMVLVSGLRKE
jgi:hypothetical protein